MNLLSWLWSVKYLSSDDKNIMKYIHIIEVMYLDSCKLIKKIPHHYKLSMLNNNIIFNSLKYPDIIKINMLDNHTLSIIESFTEIEYNEILNAISNKNYILIKSLIKLIIEVYNDIDYINIDINNTITIALKYDLSLTYIIKELILTKDSKEYNLNMNNNENDVNIIYDKDYKWFPIYDEDYKCINNEDINKDENINKNEDIINEEDSNNIIESNNFKIIRSSIIRPSISLNPLAASWKAT